MHLSSPESVDPSLFARLVAAARERAKDNEPAHDFFHVERVVQNARILARAEGADEGISVVAALLHELVTIPKGHPDAARAGDLCAEHARRLLIDEGAPANLVAAVPSAIRDHAFSKGVVPENLETCILQDADRLDALGAIGLARMWATCADMKRPFYEPSDPFCEHRSPDDKSWGLDHVFRKLLVLPERFHTSAARAIAEPRVAFVRAFVDQLRRELGGT